MHRGPVALAAGACLPGVLAPAADASRLIDRNAVGAKAVSDDGKALVTYTAGARSGMSLPGAVHALPPSQSRARPKCSGSTLGRERRAEDLPEHLPTGTPRRRVRARRGVASDGSYRALQSWQGARCRITASRAT